MKTIRFLNRIKHRALWGSVVIIICCLISGESYAEELPTIVAAIRSGDVKAVEQECKAGHVNLTPPRYGEWDFPLIEACGSTNLAILTVLVKSGAKLEAKGGRAGNSAVMTSLWKGWADGAQYLIDHGAPSEGVTPLMIAVVKRDYGEIKKLAADKSVLDAKNVSHWTALDYASPDRRCFSLLVESGASNSFSPMLTAAILDDTNKLNAALQKLPSITNSFEAIAALHCAIEYDSRNAVRLLLADGVSTGLDGEGILTALCVAAKYGRPEIIRMLLNAGADPSIMGDGGFPPGHYARVFKHTNCFELLPEYKPHFK